MTQFLVVHVALFLSFGLNAHHRDLDDERSVIESIEPEEMSAAVQDDPPCPKVFLFQFGSHFYYGTSGCNPNNDCAQEPDSPTIKYYSRRVYTGCKDIEDGCTCKNTTPPAGEYAMLADSNANYPDPNNLFGKSDSDEFVVTYSHHFVVNIRQTTKYFRTIRVDAVDGLNPSNRMTYHIAIRVNGKPDQEIIGGYLEKHGLLDESQGVLTVIHDGQQLKFKVVGRP